MSENNNNNNINNDNAKITMSPPKHKKRRSIKPKEMYIQDFVVIPPASQSKHLF